MSDLITLYHNPACSKSRACLELLESLCKQRGYHLRLRDYQQQPLDLHELTQLATRLESGIHTMLRSSESGDDNAAALSETAVLSRLAERPQLMQRPIVEWHGRAVIARPPELALQLFEP